MTTALQLLKSVYGYDSFRPLQKEVIDHVLSGNDALVLMPTGGGKSICFQIPALLLDGVTIVVSPLISLMKDQVDALQSNGIAAEALNSSYEDYEKRSIRERCQTGELKILYTSPELLMTLIPWLQRSVKVAMIAIDEAHCVSQWGHDFRPEYTQLGILSETFPGVPILALTATADKVTKADIIEQLRLRDPHVFVGSFDRPNLSLDVKKAYRKRERLRTILEVIARHRNESGIVYCLSRKGTEDLASDLRENGISVGVYHAGMTAAERNRVQEDFVNDRINVICATIAFGMGIDKSNIRFVIHNNLPKSIESFYQEIGRGGRDGLPTETILFYNLQDLITLRNFAEESGQREINLEKLARMQEYAEAQVCRRRILLNYFGETSECHCGNCDVCKNPPEHFDGTEYVQKALSAIKRCNEEVGFTVVTDVLKGSLSPMVQAKGYAKLKTFGVGRDVPANDWHSYLLQMLHMGYIEIAYNEDNHLKVTPLGEDVLFGRKRSQLSVIVREELRVTKRNRKNSVTIQPTVPSSVEDQLFEELRALRRVIAEEIEKPAYIVLSDKSLRALASEKPTNLSQFGNIYGVGEHKKDQFGDRFVDLICKHLGIARTPEPVESEVEIVAQEVVIDEPKPEKKSRPIRDFVTIKGVEYPIKQELLECIKWRPAIAQVGRDQYFTLWKDLVYPMNRYVPEDTPERDRVINRFSEIIAEAYDIAVSPDKAWIFLTKRVEYDQEGKPVHSLVCKDFEDGLQQLTEFIEQNGHYPFPESDEYECSLRRWYHEVKCGVIHISESQKQAFDKLVERFPNAIRTRAQMNRLSESE